MKTFAYTAVDSAGRAVSGMIEAADWPSAEALLAARGLVQCQETIRPQAVEGFRALNAADAAELARHVAHLAEAGLPLEEGLRAAARDLSHSPLGQALAALSARLEAGQSLETALHSLGPRLPAHVRELVTAAARSGRLAQSLDAVLAHEREMNDMARQLRQAVTYPLLLLGFFAAWILFMALWLIPEMNISSVFSDAQPFDTDPPTTIVANSLSEFAQIVPPVLAVAASVIALAFALAWLTGGRARVSWLATQVPLLGTAWSYRGLAEFSGLLKVFIDQQLPLADALRITSLAAGDPAIRAACAKAADDVARGRGLSQSLHDNSLFPPTLVQLVQWGQRHGALSGALGNAKQMFAERFYLQTQLIRSIFPPVAFLLICGSVLILMSGIFNLFVFVIALYSSGFSRQSAPYEPFVRLSGVLSVIVTGASLLAVGHLLRVMGADARASRRLLRFTGLVLINVGLLGICIMTSLLMATITWLVAHFVWIRAAIQYRAAQKRNLFAALALAVKNHMPLAPMALAFANEQEGGFARRAYALASELEEGASLSDAVLHARGALPREAALAARVGAESGDLGEALAATTHNSAFDYTLLRPAAVRMVYVVPAFLFFLTFMKIKIEPSMIKIFADFDTPLPMFSAMMMGQMGRYSPTAEVLILLMFLSFMLAVVIWLQCIGVLTPRLPGLKRIINWIDAGPLLRVLALAAETGRPLSTMLVVVGRLHPKRSLRRRVRAAVREMDDGRPWQESLQRGRLIGLADAALLAAAQRNGNLPWALGEMAESFERRANYRLQALTQVALPLLMLPMGLIVAAFMVAYFAPLTALIWSLSF